MHYRKKWVDKWHNSWKFHKHISNVIVAVIDPGNVVLGMPATAATCFTGPRMFGSVNIQQQKVNYLYLIQEWFWGKRESDFFYQIGDVRESRDQLRKPSKSKLKRVFSIHLGTFFSMKTCFICPRNFHWLVVQTLQKTVVWMFRF